MRKKFEKCLDNIYQPYLIATLNAPPTYIYALRDDWEGKNTLTVRTKKILILLYVPEVGLFLQEQ